MVKKLFLGFMPRILMMRRTKYTLPEYDDVIHTNEADMRDHYRDSITEYQNEYKDGHDAYDNGMGHQHHHHHHPGKTI